jgi:hypothetical protein
MHAPICHHTEKMVQMAAWNPAWPILLVKEKVNQGAQAAQFAAQRSGLPVNGMDLETAKHCEDHWPAAWLEKFASRTNLEGWSGRWPWP